MATGALGPGQLRLVLLGSVGEGKRSLGNTILGRDVFGSEKSVECVQNEEWVAGRQVTVINTPGWGRDQRVSQTPAAVQHGLLESVFPPGVHALLLVIRADKPFTEAHRAALQDHMELLGKNVWNHTVVVFTSGDQWGDMSIERFIFSEGSHLRWVVERCGFKYGRIDINERADITQVLTLLGHIEQMAGHIGLFKLSDEKYKEEIYRREAEEKALKQMQQQAWGMGGAWGSPPPRPESTNTTFPSMDNNIKAEPAVASSKYHKDTI